jgi:Zn-dependent M28 family amino/carboxypeptidase
MLWLALALLAQDRPKSIDALLKRVKVEEIKKLHGWVASDELEGRCPGYPGEEKVTEHFAKIYKEAGLKPAGDDNTYFQKIGWKTGSGNARNTLALLEGADLKDQYIVIGGHHDHVGKRGQHRGQYKEGPPEDEIYNGADDNGSGSSTVVTLARLFGESGLKPRRSIIFMTFTCEESGLIGSKYFVDHPTRPLEKIVAAINMDMVGRHSKQTLKIEGVGYEEGDDWEKMVDRCVAKIEGFKPKVNARAEGGSDHESFLRKSIPTLYFRTGVHSDWHRVTDHVEKIDYDGMEKTCRVGALILWELANTDKKWTYVRPAKK